MVHSGFEGYWICVDSFWTWKEKNKAHQGKVYCCPDQIPYFVQILEKTRSTTWYLRQREWKRKTDPLMRVSVSSDEISLSKISGVREVRNTHTNIEICSNTTYNATHTHTDNRKLTCSMRGEKGLKAIYTVFWQHVLWKTTIWPLSELQVSIHTKTGTDNRNKCSF